MPRKAKNRLRWPHKPEDLGYQRANLDAIATAALKRAKRLDTEWPAALDRIATVVEEIIAAPPFLPEKPPPRALLGTVERSARRLFNALAKQRDEPDFMVRWMLDQRLYLALFELNEALAARVEGRGRPRVRFVGAVAETLAAAWHAEGLSFEVGAKFREREWVQLVEYVFGCARLPWANKHALETARHWRK